MDIDVLDKDHVMYNTKYLSQGLYFDNENPNDLFGLEDDL
jgi:hypothetical protein